MWFKQFTIAAAVLCWALQISAQVITNQAPVPATVVVAGQKNPKPVYNSLLATNLHTGLTAPALSSNRTPPKLPMPGIYKTEPYACIVLVPGEKADDRSVVKPPERGSAMPVVKPELRFIPLPAK